MKTFCKKKTAKKNFFSCNANVRSLAYGEDVKKEYADWLRYHSSRWLTARGGFVLFDGGNAAGKTFTEAKGSKGELPSLKLDGEVFCVQSGRVAVGSKKDVLNIGTEVKAWALSSIPTTSGVKTFMFAVAKRPGGKGTTLAVYSYRPHPSEFVLLCEEPLPTVLDLSATLVTLGRHVFLVLGGQLRYYYFSHKDLQPVAIGVNDGCDKDFLHHVKGYVVANEAHKVFWISDESVYAFTIGLPSSVSEYRSVEGEVVEHIDCLGGGLNVYTKRRHGTEISCIHYD
ncbi:MAG: hypothetical protein IKC48_03745 [Clostridia bacterium]|nr:hypothetical protein [Clostridia bacterium]